MILLLIILAVLLVPLKVAVQYGENGVLVKVKVWLFSVFKYPGNKKPKEKKEKKEKKPKKEKKKQKKNDEKKKEESTDDGKEEKPKKKNDIKRLIPLIRKMLPIAKDIFGGMLRSLTFSVLNIDLTLAGEKDPAKAAITYGQINASLGCLWHPINEIVDLKDAKVHTQVDYNTTTATIDVYAEIMTKLIRLLPIVIVCGVRALIVFLKWRKQGKQKGNGK